MPIRITDENSFRHKLIRKGAPILLLLHGTGGNEEEIIPLGEALDPNATLLSVRGKVLENGMPRFFRRLAEGVFDIEDLKFRTQELANFVSLISSEKKLGRIVAVGYSNGANIAASLLLLRPEILSGAVLFRAMVPFVPDSYPDLENKPVLISDGSFDSIIPHAQANKLADILRKSCADVTLRLQQSDHQLVDEDIRDAREWLLRFKKSIENE